MAKLPDSNLTQTAEIAAACARANVACLLLGSPGTGKTSISRAISAQLDMPCITLIASNMEATDFAGLPYVAPHEVDDGNETRTVQRVQRALFPEIEQACDEPVILFLDEITAIPRSVEAPMLRLALERNAGGRQLHPGTRILMAGNFPDQAPGGITLSAAMVNRLVQVKVQPQVDEVANFFAGTPVVPDLSHLLSEEDALLAYKEEAEDFALAAKHLGDLIEFNPPEASIADGQPWASPRAWELGLRAYSALARDYATGQGDLVGAAILSGILGTGPALKFLAQRELRKNLPTPDQIANEPERTPIPTERKFELAAITVARRAAERDFWATFVWLDRLPSAEIKRAAASMIAKSVPVHKVRNPKWTKAGADAFGRLVAHNRAIF